MSLLDGSEITQIKPAEDANNYMREMLTETVGTAKESFVDLFEDVPELVEPVMEIAIGMVAGCMSGSFEILKEHELLVLPEEDYEAMVDGLFDNLDD